MTKEAAYPARVLRRVFFINACVLDKTSDRLLIGASQCLKSAVALPSAQNSAAQSPSTKSNSRSIALPHSRTADEARRTEEANIAEANRRITTSFLLLRKLAARESVLRSMGPIGVQ